MKMIFCFLSITTCFLFSNSAFAELTNPMSSSFFNRPNGSNAKKAALKKQILCGFQQNGANSTEQKQRTKYIANEWASVISRLDPPINANGVNHLIAQTTAETGALKALKEKKSEYASSIKKHCGRGAFQTTHEGNYAKLAGCAQVIKNNPPPAKITQQMIANAKPIRNSFVVKNPNAAMSENTKDGRRLNALSAICYSIDTANRHPRFARALKGNSAKDISEVGVAINRGPGALGKGKRPLGARKRRNAFLKAKSCPRANI